MATAPTGEQLPFGAITLDGITFIERPQIFVLEYPIASAGQRYTNQRLTMPGIANFRLKGLSRDTLLPGPPQPPGMNQSSDRRFWFRLMNGAGSVWYFSGGLGPFDDYVIDSNCFGSGQFPYPIIPPIPLDSTGSLVFDLEDWGIIDPNNPNEYPYTIYLAFHGSFLIPASNMPIPGQLFEPAPDYVGTF